jgi:two-component system response regulator LytT
MILTCVIIEDEIPAQKILQNYISKIPNFELIETFNNATDAHNFLTINTTINIVFLDINLPDISGIDFIKTIENPPAIIMTTAYPDYAIDSFELDTIVDYLVKPFSFDRFLKGAHKAEKYSQKTSTNSTAIKNEVLFLNVDKTLHKIAVNDILYIESDRNYITVITKEKKLSYIASLKNWKEKLPEKKFIQVHKSFIINSTFVEKITGNELFIHQNKIPIGRTYKQDLLQQLKIV